MPLFSDKVSIESVSPDDAVLVRSGKTHALVVEGRRRVRVTLQFNVPVEKGEAKQSVAFGVAPAAISSLKVAKDSEFSRFRLEGGCLRGDTWYLSGSDSIRMEVATAANQKVALPAIVSSVTSGMNVVREGALFNTMCWHVSHHSPLDFKLEMPSDVQFVDFSVAGSPAQPTVIDGRHVEVHLPEPSGNATETVVNFSYTARKSAFAPVRGELALELPSTPLLVKKEEWLVALPSGYEVVSLQGNVDREPSKEPGIVRLRKEISLGETPSMQIAYQNAEINMPAIVSLMSSAMRVVRDGALYNAMSWNVRHQSAIDFKLEMPPDIQFVAITVGGRPAQPARVDGRHVEIHLPELKEGATGTVVGFSYTSHKSAFLPVRGELALELPSTPLLVEKSEWQVSLPDGFDPIAIDGNVECEPSKEPGIVRLRKEISTGEAPALRLFYQKPETAKK